MDLLAQIKKMVILYVYLRICTTKTQFYRTDAQIKKIKMVCEGKNFAHHLMRICIAVYFLKKSQPETNVRPQTKRDKFLTNGQFLIFSVP
jgi:hypothetical protein